MKMMFFSFYSCMPGLPLVAEPVYLPKYAAILPELLASYHVRFHGKIAKAFCSNTT
jgi:hypothetical protein